LRSAAARALNTHPAAFVVYGRQTEIMSDATPNRSGLPAGRAWPGLGCGVEIRALRRALACARSLSLPIIGRVPCAPVA